MKKESTIKYDGECMLNSDYYAIVDTEKKKIVYVDVDCIGAMATLTEDIIAVEVDTWLEVHPNHTEMPTDLFDALKKRYIIAKCHCAVLPSDLVASIKADARSAR